MNKKIPTLKTIEKEFDEKFTYHDDVFDEHTNLVGRKVEAEISVLTSAWTAEEIKSFFRQQIGEILNYLEMEEPPIPPVVIGFSNHKVVGEVTEEQIEELMRTNEAIGYKEAAKEVNRKIGKIKGR